MDDGTDIGCEDMKCLGKGLANTNRYRILQTLLEGPKSVGEVVDAVDMTQPAVSQHLRVLKESDLVTSTKDGQNVYYHVDTEHMLELLQFLLQQLSEKKTVSEHTD